MSPQKLTLTILMISIIEIVCLCLSPKASAEKNYDVPMVEMTTRNYSFMHEIADLLRNTNHFVTDSNASIMICDEHSYDIQVYEFDLNSRKKKKSSTPIDFKPRGSYIISITYQIGVALYDNGNWLGNTFFVDGLRFTTIQDLGSYFVACKTDKSICTFGSGGWWYDRFWFFEVNNGEIINLIMTNHTLLVWPIHNPIMGLPRFFIYMMSPFILTLI